MDRSDTPQLLLTSGLARGARLLNRRISRAETSLPGLEQIAVLALASSRLTRVVTLDEITAPLRERLDAKAQDDADSTWVWANRLVSCPACVGWWVSLGISVALPGRHRLLRGASVAGAQMFLALVERLVSEQGRAAISGADVAEAYADDVHLEKVDELAS